MGNESQHTLHTNEIDEVFQNGILQYISLMIGLTVTPEDQQCKTPAQLMSTVSSFMINEIARMPKMTGKKKVSQKNIELINNANRAAACLVEYSIKSEEDKSNSNHLKK